MSLINKMLKDLEARQGAGLARGDRPIFQDLQPVREEQRRARGLLLVLFAALAFAGGGYYAWDRWLAAPRPASPAPVAVVNTPVAVPPAQEPAQVASATPPTAAAPAARNAPPAAKPAAPQTSSTRAAPARPAAVTTASKAAPASAAAKPEPTLAPGRIEVTPHAYTPEELAENAYREAARLKADGNTGEAERRLKTLLASDPRHAKARELLASIQLESGRWLEAQDTLEQGIVKSPDYLPFRYQLARLYVEHGADAQAVTLLEQARAEGRRDADLSAYLAALYQRANRHADAVKSYQDALALKPQEGRWWLGLGISLEAEQQSSSARDAYRHALDSGRLAANLAHYAEDRLRALTTR